ncbi:MAG: hypothetical protein HWD59_05740 [Coxiellaceae bacterium]|nr:MAG: hypothetical protein HWD59_05740 [Coxiellaceae bacterium]
MTSIHANSIPLIFPRNLLASLELDMPILDVFYKAEALNLGAVITNYSFEKNKEGLYELSIVFSYHDCLGKAIGCYRSVVASFNAFTVEAYLKKTLTMEMTLILMNFCCWLCMAHLIHL